jgi:Ca2+-binding RTX toxin-like protein
VSIINLFDQPRPPPPVEFTAFLATDMDAMLLRRLPEGFIRTLSDDAIVVDFFSGNAARLLGEFDYSSPIDLPIDGDMGRYQELVGGAIQFEAKNLNASIIAVLGLAGDEETNENLFDDILFVGNDKFTGSAGNDLLRSYSGDDRIDGRAGADSLFGGAGNDSIVGGEGASYLRGEDGDDSLVGGNDFDDMHGNKGDDTLTAGAGADWVVGGQGNDRLLAGDGDDIVYGNLGSDSLVAGAGNDTLRGGQADDVMEGGDGDDWMSGDRGFDVLYGGRGADTFHFFPGSELDRVHDFNAAEGDRVNVQLGTLYTVQQVGSDVLIRVGLVDQMVLVNVQLSSLPVGWLTEG